MFLTNSIVLTQNQCFDICLNTMIVPELDPTDLSVTDSSVSYFGCCKSWWLNGMSDSSFFASPTCSILNNIQIISEQKIIWQKSGKGWVKGYKCVKFGFSDSSNILSGVLQSKHFLPSNQVLKFGGDHNILHWVSFSTLKKFSKTKVGGVILLDYISSPICDLPAANFPWEIDALLKWFHQLHSCAPLQVSNPLLTSSSTVWILQFVGSHIILSRLSEHCPPSNTHTCTIASANCGMKEPPGTWDTLIKPSIPNFPFHIFKAWKLYCCVLYPTAAAFCITEEAFCIIEEYVLHLFSRRNLYTASSDKNCL